MELQEAHSKSSHIIISNSSSKSEDCSSCLKEIQEIEARIQKENIQVRFLERVESYTSIARLIFNTLIVTFPIQFDLCVFWQGFIVLALLFSIAYVLVMDVNKKTGSEIKQMNERIRICSKEYLDNRCEPETRVPMLETFCREKELCMSQDTRFDIKTTQMMAQIVANSLNGLILGLEYKTIFVLVLFFLG